MAQQYVQQLMQSVDGILFQLRVYQDAQRVRNDCFEVLRSTPSLQPRMGSLRKLFLNIKKNLISHFFFFLF